MKLLNILIIFALVVALSGCTYQAVEDEAAGEAAGDEATDDAETDNGAETEESNDTEEVCPTIIGWRIEDGACVEDSGCDYDAEQYTYYSEENCTTELESTNAA